MKRDARRGLADSIDLAGDQWRAVMPELEAEPLQLAARLWGLGAWVAREVERFALDQGLSPQAFDVLVTLRRMGPPYQLALGRLARERKLTHGAMSQRIDQLAEAGLVERADDPHDRRATLVRLTAAGRARIDGLLPEHCANYDRLFAGLADRERADLKDLLRRLMQSVEAVGGEEARARLGLVLLPAHESVRRRRATGLPGSPGLMVTAVVAGSPAAAAGLAQGDLLVAAAGRELRSIPALLEAVNGLKEVTLTLIRGLEQRSVRLRP